MQSGRWGRRRPRAIRHIWARAVQARVRQAERMLAFRRARLDALYEEITAAERTLADEIEGEEASYSAHRTYWERSRSVPVSQPSPHPEENARLRSAAELPGDARRNLLWVIFDEMEGHEEEFLEDGRPRVETVNSRLSEHNQETGITRREIDEAYEMWKQSRHPEV